MTVALYRIWNKPFRSFNNNGGRSSLMFLVLSNHSIEKFLTAVEFFVVFDFVNSMGRGWFLIASHLHLDYNESGSIPMK